VSTDKLDGTFERVTTLVAHYHRDAPFRAPESVPGWRAQLLNNIWVTLVDGIDGKVLVPREHLATLAAVAQDSVESGAKGPPEFEAIRAVARAAAAAAQGETAEWPS